LISVRASALRDRGGGLGDDCGDGLSARFPREFLAAKPSTTAICVLTRMLFGASRPGGSYSKRGAPGAEDEAMRRAAEVEHAQLIALIDVLSGCTVISQLDTSPSLPAGRTSAGRIVGLDE
jgi:hypothetical protein